MHSTANITPISGMVYLNPEIGVRASHQSANHPAEHGCSVYSDRFWMSGVVPRRGHPITFRIDLSTIGTQFLSKLRVRMTSEGAKDYISGHGTPADFDVKCSKVGVERTLVTVQSNVKTSLLWFFNLLEADELIFEFYDANRQDITVRFDLYGRDSVDDSYLIIGDQFTCAAFSTESPHKHEWNFGSIEEQARILSGGRPLLIVPGCIENLTAAEALMYYDNLYRDVPTSLVILTLGVSDALNRTEESQFQSNLSELVHRILASKRSVILSLLPVTSYPETNVYLRKYNLIISSMMKTLKGQGVSIGPDVFQTFQSRTLINRNNALTSIGFFTYQRMWTLFIVRDIWNVNIDALMSRSGYELISFMKWVNQPNADGSDDRAKGIITEFGVPATHPTFSQNKWNTFLTAYLRMVRESGLHIMGWLSGSLINTQAKEYPISIYSNKGGTTELNATSATAEIYEREFLRFDFGATGFTLSGPEAGHVDRAFKGVWPTENDFKFLRQHEVSTIRLLLGQENMQSELELPINEDALDNLAAVMGYAKDNDIALILALNNNGHYRISNEQYEPISALGEYRWQNIAKFWSRISKFLAENDSNGVVVALDITNCPYDVQSADIQDLSFMLCQTLRLEKETRTIIVPTGFSSRMEAVSQTHPFKYVRDPQKNVWYAARHFVNLSGGDRDGSFRSSYDDELAVAVAAGF